MIQPKIGIISSAHAWFAQKIYRGSLGWDLKHVEEAAMCLSKHNVKTILFDSFIWKSSDIVKASQFFKTKDVDAILVYHPYFTDEAHIPALANELKDYPLILWADPKLTLTLCGLITSASNLKRINRKFEYVLGSPKEEETIKKILAFARAASVAKRLRRSIIGVIGTQNPGQLDTAHDEYSMRQIIGDIVHLDGAQLYDEYQRADEKKTVETAEKVANEMGCCEIEKNQLVDAAKVYLAMKALVDRYNLDGLTIRAWPELMERGITTCLGSSLLWEEGIPCEGFEVDVSATITQLICHLLTGKPSFCGEIFRVYPQKNTVLLAHPGYLSPSLAKNYQEVKLVSSRFASTLSGEKRGVDLEFSMKLGRVTAMKLTGRPVDGKLKMLIAGGEVVDDTEHPGGGRAIAILKPDIPLMDFLNTWIREGFEHHIIVAEGNIKKELEKLCEILNVQKVTV